MKTYKELKDNFFDEVGKIDISKLSLTPYGNNFKEYAELLKVMAEIPEESKGSMLYGLQNSCCTGFGGAETPRLKE